MKKSGLPASLTPDAVALMEAVHQHGSLAGAARALGLVPSALSYRMRQLEEALDVLLVNRTSRQARLTDAGQELRCEGRRLLLEFESLAERIQRVATGWEPQFTIAVDTALCQRAVMEVCGEFLALQPPTRLRIRSEALSGTLAAVLSGRADLALGVAGSHALLDKSVQTQLLGHLDFVYAVAPGHALAAAAEPLSDADLMPHRAVAVADSVPQGSGLNIGLIGGQKIFTVQGMAEKLAAQLSGIGGGFLPEHLARPHINAGRLVEKSMQRPARVQPLLAAWRQAPGPTAKAAARTPPPGQALRWWLLQLAKERTRQALVGRV